MTIVFGPIVKMVPNYTDVQGVTPDQTGLECFANDGLNRVTCIMAICFSPANFATIGDDRHIIEIVEWPRWAGKDQMIADPRLEPQIGEHIDRLRMARRP